MSRTEDMEAALAALLQVKLPSGPDFHVRALDFVLTLYLLP